ncbi:putative H/ACA ribonucleoprotein complex, subunit Gar1/Naf1 [Helianthus debilis subsp. tardiflorus]
MLWPLPLSLLRTICAFTTAIQAADLVAEVAEAAVSGSAGTAERRGHGGGGRFGGDRFNEGPPERLVEVSSFVHACEGDAFTKLTNEKIPYSNAPTYLQNKTQIGKVDEIFGPINESKVWLHKSKGKPSVFISFNGLTITGIDDRTGVGFPPKNQDFIQ